MTPGGGPFSIGRWRDQVNLNLDSWPESAPAWLDPGLAQNLTNGGCGKALLAPAPAELARLKRVDTGMCDIAGRQRVVILRHRIACIILPGIIASSLSTYVA